MRRVRMLALIAVLGLLPHGARAGVPLPDPDARVARTFVLLEEPAARDEGWDPRAFRAQLEDRLLSMLPDGVIQDVARTFADRTLQIDLSPDRAFVRLRLPL